MKFICKSVFFFPHLKKMHVKLKALVCNSITFAYMISSGELL